MLLSSGYDCRELIFTLGKVLFRKRIITHLAFFQLVLPYSVTLEGSITFIS